MNFSYTHVVTRVVFAGSRGVGISGTRIVYSSDFGKTWQDGHIEQPERHGGTINNIALDANGFGCAVGYGGLVYITTDYGATWKDCFDSVTGASISTPAGPNTSNGTNFTAVSIIDDRTVMISDDWGYILKIELL